MEFSIAALLANFTEDKLVAPKALEKKLDCNDATSQLKLQIALEALEKIGILVKDKGPAPYSPIQVFSVGSLAFGWQRRVLR